MSICSSVVCLCHVLLRCAVKMHKEICTHLKGLALSTLVITQDWRCWHSLVSAPFFISKVLYNFRICKPVYEEVAYIVTLSS